MEKEPLEVSDVRIEGMQTAASFNIQTDVLTVDESSVATINPYHNATTGFYEAIILPSALTDSYKVSFVLTIERKSGYLLIWTLLCRNSTKVIATHSHST